MAVSVSLIILWLKHNHLLLVHNISRGVPKKAVDCVAVFSLIEKHPSAETMDKPGYNLHHQHRFAIMWVCLSTARYMIFMYSHISV